RFTESQIVAVLKEGEAGMPVTEILRKHGISRQTHFTWKSKYGGASVKDLTRLKELEQENAKLKRMYAELAFENAAIKDVLAGQLWRRPRRGRPSDSSPQTTGSRCSARVAPSDCRGRRTPGRLPRASSRMTRSSTPCRRS